jgi:hypothetical protein
MRIVSVEFDEDEDASYVTVRMSAPEAAAIYELYARQVPPDEMHMEIEAVLGDAFLRKYELPFYGDGLEIGSGRDEEE